MKIIENLDLRKLREVFDFHYLRPEQLNEKEAICVELKNHAYENDWSLPRTIEGWVHVEAWFNNMVAGQTGRRGATRLQWRSDMGLPILLSSHSNYNSGSSMWFIPKVAIGGEPSWNIRFEFEYSKQEQSTLARLFAEKVKNKEVIK